MSKKVLLSDIARELNISTTAVSVVLNGKAKERRISPELVEKILALVKAKDYKINLLAKGLRTGKSKIIALFVEDISNQFFANFARRIEEKANSAGYTIIYCSTNDDTRKTKGLIQTLKSQQVDGYIITPPEGIEEDVLALIEDNFPVVLFDRCYQGTLINHVAIDNFKSVYAGVKHLVDRGYKNIAFITILSGQSQMKGRLEGYKKCIVDHQLSNSIAEIDRSKPDVHIIKQIKSYLEINKHIDSILFSTNFLTMKGLKAIHELGIKIPREIAVMSFDDNEFFEIFQPTITAIAQPIDLLAASVIKILLRSLSGKDQIKTEYHTVMIPGNLIVRNSTPSKKTRKI